jgi:hypothetical protein
MSPTARLTMTDDNNANTKILFDQGSEDIGFDGFQGPAAGYTRWYIGHNIGWGGGYSTGNWQTTSSLYRSIFYNDNGTLRYAYIPASAEDVGATGISHTKLQSLTSFSVNYQGYGYLAGGLGLGRVAAQTTETLTNVGGNLYWGSTPLVGGGATGGGWTDGGTNVYLTTATDRVGIGTSAPYEELDIKAQSLAAFIGLSGPGDTYQYSGVDLWDTNTNFNGLLCRAGV